MRASEAPHDPARLMGCVILSTLHRSKSLPLSAGYHRTIRRVVERPRNFWKKERPNVPQHILSLLPFYAELQCRYESVS
jgi:hypothetical protein